MKKLLLAALVIAGAATVSSADAQTFRAPAGPTARERVERPVTPLPPRSVGAVPRSRGNPVQMINPAAPQRYYGSPDETVSSERALDRTRNAAEESSHVPHTGLILCGLRL